MILLNPALVKMVVAAAVGVMAAPAAAAAAVLVVVRAPTACYAPVLIEACCHPDLFCGCDGSGGQRATGAFCTASLVFAWACQCTLLRSSTTQNTASASKPQTES